MKARAENELVADSEDSTALSAYRLVAQALTQEDLPSLVHKGWCDAANQAVCIQL